MVVEPGDKGPPGSATNEAMPALTVRISVLANPPTATVTAPRDTVGATFNETATVSEELAGTGGRAIAQTDAPAGVHGAGAAERSAPPLVRRRPGPWGVTSTPTT